MNNPLEQHPEWMEGTIDLSNKIELVFWCRMLGCNQRNLQKAVMEIGTSPKMVVHYLELNRMRQFDYMKPVTEK